MTRIFVLDGHPASQSLSRTLAQAYVDAAREAGHEVRLTHLNDLAFDPDFGAAHYRSSKALEPALEGLLQDLSWSEHFVMASPMWWGGLPAKLKGLFDRALLPGRTFDARRKSLVGLPLPLLAGRSARVMVTSDTPGWFMRLAYRNALMWQLRGQVLGFVGFQPVRITHLGPASEPRAGQVSRWVTLARRLGRAAR